MRTVDFPAHACGLYLTHNEHRDTYTPLLDFIDARNLVDDFESPEAMQRAVDTNECWVLQWYPDTTVGFCRVAAPTLTEALQMACAPSAAQPAALSVRDQLQQKCVEMGAYWQESDAHGVALTTEQAAELLREVLGVEVEIHHGVKAPPGLLR